MYALFFQSFASKVSSLDLKNEQESINLFLKKLRHRYVQRICSIKHMDDIEEGTQREKEFVIITQPLWGVSLRDLIHGVVILMVGGSLRVVGRLGEWKEGSELNMRRGKGTRQA